MSWFDSALAAARTGARYVEQGGRAVVSGGQAAERFFVPSSSAGSGLFSNFTTSAGSLLSSLTSRLGNLGSSISTGFGNFVEGTAALPGRAVGGFVSGIASPLIPTIVVILVGLVVVMLIIGKLERS